MVLWCGAAMAEEELWTRYRGPQGCGKTAHTDLPVEWGPEKNIVWKQKLIGPGSSHPVLWQDRIYLTAYSGYKRDGKDKDPTTKDLRLHVLCLKQSDGSTIWQYDIDPEKLKKPSHFHGPATPTPCVDADAVYVSFGLEGLYAISHDGKELWHAQIEGEEHGWGSAASPILWKDLILWNTSIENSHMTAIDRTTGELRWRKPLETKRYFQSWSTPIVITAPDGREELIANMATYLISFDPATGTKFWEIKADHGYASASPIYEDGVIYNISAEGHGRRAGLAVRPGDVPEDQRILWKQDYGVNCSCAVLYEGKLYWPALAKVDQSIKGFYCADAKTGEVIYKIEDYESLFPNDRRKEVYSSAFAGGGHIYYVNRAGGTFVIKAGDTFDVVATNFTGDEGEGKWHCPPVPLPDGRLLLRSDWGLHCIGK
jgi:hypothetical protein